MITKNPNTDKVIRGKTEKFSAVVRKLTSNKGNIMGVGGLEPPRPKSGQQILSLVRLPIPPHSPVIARISTMLEIKL